MVEEADSGFNFRRSCLVQVDFKINFSFLGFSPSFYMVTIFLPGHETARFGAGKRIFAVVDVDCF